jgi:hypothetical protein
VKAEEQREVAVDAFLLKDFGGAMPSQVEAILMRMRSRPMPAWSYCAMMARAWAMVASVS